MAGSHQHDRSGRVAWIGLRPSRSAPIHQVQQTLAEQGTGLVDDRFAGGSTARQVTLFQMEHLDTIAKFMGVERIEPQQTRRNIGVSGMNLHALIHCKVEIGDCVLQITGDCPPCQRMETTIGPGGLAAMSGLGGVTASVIRAGAIRVGDRVRKA